MIFRVALRAIWRNKVRSLLTALGIIVGIAAVIAVIAIGNGASEQMKSSINSMGNNLVMIFPGAMRSGGMSMGAGASNTLTAEDGEQLEKDYPELVMDDSEHIVDYDLQYQYHYRRYQYFHCYCQVQ